MKSDLLTTLISTRPFALDGLIIGMAPPESYLDISSSKFSRYVNLTEPARGWHSDFHYFGENVYAYLLQKYGSYIDFVSVQFYESYSKASLAVHHNGMSPAEYLIGFVERLRLNGETMYVDFSSDPDASVRTLDPIVSFPLNKLVFGLANGWASPGDEKALYIQPKELGFTWKRLSAQNSLPRGFMFWTINEEGNRGVFLAKELYHIVECSVEDE